MNMAEIFRDETGHVRVKCTINELDDVMFMIKKER
jgi:hypothetical protein